VTSARYRHINESRDTIFERRAFVAIDGVKVCATLLEKRSLCLEPCLGDLCIPFGAITGLAAIISERAFLAPRLRRNLKCLGDPFVHLRAALELIVAQSALCSRIYEAVHVVGEQITSVGDLRIQIDDV
jgi:hypothetical protein